MRTRTQCAFCTERAKWTYEDVPMCRWHMVLFYLGLTQDAHD